MSDPYLTLIREHWDTITRMSVAFEHKNPIIEFDIVRLQILAYPAKEYLDGLSERTREQAKSQHRQAASDGALMLFVRDEKQRVLRSYIFPRADEATHERKSPRRIARSKKTRHPGRS